MNDFDIRERFEGEVNIFFYVVGCILHRMAVTSYSQYLGLYAKASTKKAYGTALRRFLDYIYPPDVKRPASDAATYDHLSLQYLREDRDIPSDLRGFAVVLNRYAPMTAQLYLSGTFSWLEENEIEVSRSQRRRIGQKMPSGGPQTREADVDHVVLKKILAHMDLKGRALVLTLASSGMRIGEALKLSIRDLDLSQSPATINLPGTITKNGAPRLTFVTEEAAQALSEWLKVRDEYLRSSAFRNSGLVAAGHSRPKDITADDRVFPFSRRNAWEIWERALTGAGLLERDPTTNRLTRTYHGLRKFFLSQSKLVISAEIPEALSGHRGYLTDAYRRYTNAQLAEEYKKAEPQLTIQAPQEIREIQSEFRQKMEVHSEILENLVSENIQLKKRLESVEETQAQVDHLAAILAEHQEVTKGS
ncbi:tyrosine-type recombinase/integrase [Methanofollis aquaemaris]|nr:site-specific integrase [Methanofollis aquaemaris]